MNTWNTSDTKPIDNDYKIVLVNRESAFDGYKSVTKDVQIAKWNGHEWDIKDCKKFHGMTVLFWISIPEFEKTLN